jgi:hypothetical protein
MNHFKAEFKGLVSSMVNTFVQSVEARLAVSLRDWPDSELLLYCAEPDLTNDQIRERFREGIRAIHARQAKLLFAERQAKSLGVAPTMKIVAIIVTAEH